MAVPAENDTKRRCRDQDGFPARRGGLDLRQNENETPLQPGAPTALHDSFDPGRALALSVGYGLAGGLRVEIDGPERADGLQRQRGGFGNVIYDVPLALPVRSCLGPGLGHQAVDLDDVNSSTCGVGGAPSGSATHGSFACQGIAGFADRLRFLRSPSLAVDDRLIGVATPPAFERSRVTTMTIPVETAAPFGAASEPVTTRRSFRIAATGETDFRRADAVRAALIADGVAGGAITVSAFGATHLLVPTGPDTREPQNRRVLILLR